MPRRKGIESAAATVAPVRTAGIDVPDVVRSLVTLSTVATSILALWLITWPTASERLDRERLGLSLVAYASLHAEIGRLEQEIRASSEWRSDGLESISSTTREVFSGRSEVLVTSKIMVPVPWPESGSYPLALFPLPSPDPAKALSPEWWGPGCRVFRLEAPSAPVPIGDYLAVFFEKMGDRPTISIVAAFLCSCVIGVTFGFLPARSAARLDPVEALARE